MFSRHAYAMELKALDAAGKLPERLAAFSVDINGLKTVNDTLGHEAGDELICGAARCIESALGGWGKCYRTGGDEFVVLARISPPMIPEALSRLYTAAANWKGTLVDALHLSAGCAAAAEHPDLTAEKLVCAADQAMYAEKAAYYRQAGVDRRHR